LAIPDHPWVDGADGAAVRIAMTIASASLREGVLSNVVDESPLDDGEVAVTLARRSGEIHPDLTVGARVGAAVPLRANEGLCFQGMNLVGKGFRITADEVRELGFDPARLPEVIKPHRNARDMMQGGQDCFVIDLFGLDERQAREQYPSLYQWLLVRVKPERDQNNRPSRQRNWWLFGEPVGKLRRAWAGLPRVILSPETAKHRVFEFQHLPFCPDHKLYAITIPSTVALGVLSSRAHATWAMRAGGRLGVGNDPTWTNTTCFLPFPFPEPVHQSLHDRIEKFGDAIDGHRRKVIGKHPGLDLTGIYNVLEKLRRGEALTAKDKVIHDQGLVSVLRELHDDLDRAVFAAYGWEDLGERLVGKPGATTPWPEKPAEQAEAEEELLARLVALNAERAAEEARGLVRWLRPEFQNPATGHAPATQDDLALPDTGEDDAPAATVPRKTRGKPRGVSAADAATDTTAAPAPAERQPWPKTAPEQARAVADVLTAAKAPMTLDAIADRFTARGRWRERLPQLLDTLVALGRARAEGNRWRGA
jgi:hypothetical protein